MMTFQQIAQQLGRPLRRLRASRSLVLPSRSKRRTRIYTDPHIESRGRISIVPPHRSDQPFTGPPLTEHRVRTAIEAVERGIAMWERTQNAPGAKSWEREFAPVRLSEYRDERKTLLGLERAWRFFPEQAFITRAPRYTQNGLLGSALAAYKDHQGLLLAPEAFAATIAQGIARFTYAQDRASIPHDERTKLTMRLCIDGPIGAMQPAAVAEELVDALITHDTQAAQLGTILGRLHVAPNYRPMFDTMLLAAFDARYHYGIGFYACGIRRIEVEGEPEEWHAVAEAARAVAAMPEYTPLVPWLTAVAVTMDTIATSSPRDAASRAFMERIVAYDPPACSSGYATGWITHLFPFAGGTLRTEFPSHGGPKLEVFGSCGLSDHLLAKARVRVEPHAPLPEEPFDIQLVAGLDVAEEPCGDMNVYRSVPFHGLWAPIQQ